MQFVISYRNNFFCSLRHLKELFCLQISCNQPTRNIKFIAYCVLLKLPSKIDYSILPLKNAKCILHFSPIYNIRFINNFRPGLIVSLERKISDRAWKPSFCETESFDCNRRNDQQSIVIFYSRVLLFFNWSTAC